MILLFLFIILLLFIEGYILLEEEFLIILANIFWLSTFSKFILISIEQELYYKSNMIKYSYEFFLYLKKMVIIDIINLHKNRLVIKKTFIIPLFNLIIIEIFSIKIISFIEKFVFIENLIKKEDIIFCGKFIVDEIILRLFEKTFGIYEDNFGNL